MKFNMLKILRWLPVIITSVREATDMIERIYKSASGQAEISETQRQAQAFRDLEKLNEEQIPESQEVVEESEEVEDSTEIREA